MGLLIAGMHRSGTSMVAQWTDRLWGPDGARHRLRRKWWQRSRTVRDNRGRRLDDQWLGVLGGSWWAPHRAGTDLALHRRTIPGHGPIVGSADSARRIALVHQDPRISLLLPLWDRLLLSRQPVAVGVRPHREVAMSLHVRNGTRFRRGLAIWWAYNGSVARHGGNRPSVVIDYDRSLADPDHAVGAFARFLADVGMPTDPEQVAEVVGGIEPTLRRQHVESLDGTAERLAADLDPHYEALAAAHGAALPVELPPPRLGRGGVGRTQRVLGRERTPRHGPRSELPGQSASAAHAAPQVSQDRNRFSTATAR